MTKPVVASDVRKFYRAKPERIEALSPEAQVSVKEGARGRLHPEAIKGFNAKRRKDSRYADGATLAVTNAAKAEAKAVRESLGDLAGARGPLSNAAKAALAQPKN